MPGLHRLSVALGPAAMAPLSFFPTSIALGDKEREEKLSMDPATVLKGTSV